jgi:hypothetical protein
VKYLRWTGVGLLALAGLLYGGDWLVARSRGPLAFGSVVVQPYYAVALKNGKTEFIMLAPDTRACVYALFPHFGDAPCWYLEGHQRQRIDIGRNQPGWWLYPVAVPKAFESSRR